MAWSTSFVLTQDQRIELLSKAPKQELLHLADLVLQRPASPAIISGPEVGLVMMQVREPVCDERFFLGEVLVTRAEVELGGVRGWSMRMGEDRVTTLAAAILDAEAAGGGEFTDHIVSLCHEVKTDLRWTIEQEWAEIAPTEVHFDVID